MNGTVGPTLNKRRTMNASLKDLIAALPQEESDAVPNEAEISRKELQRIFDDLAHRPMPLGSLHRFWTMGGLSTHVALAYMALWIRQWFANEGKRKQQLVETNLRVALKIIHRLGYLRGAAAKLGQALGNLPDILPDQVVDTLDRLHFDAPPMHFSLLQEMVRNEFEKDPEDVFKTFEKDAFAAASLGQVHRARLKSGEQVAVKIQYPGIARTIDSDLRNVAVLLFPARLSNDWDYTKAQFEEIHRMLKVEADYQQEAKNIRRVRTLFRPEDGILVPHVYDAYSTKRILTTDYIPGVHLEAFLRSKPTQAVRNSVATKIYIAWARMYNANMNYADPHSGNYLFMADGRLALLDFGCVQQFGKEETELLKMAERIADEPEILKAMLRRCGMTEKQLSNADLVGLMRESCNWVLEPIRANKPFDFSDENHLKRGIEIFARIVLKRYTRSHPMFVYWNRSVIGIRALMYQLRARVNVYEVFAKERPLKSQLP
jgi:aarF domain-containing kinase